MDEDESVDGRRSAMSMSDRSENGLGEERMWVMDECEGEDGAEEDWRWQ